MGKKYVPPEGTRHILLPKDIIEGNFLMSTQIQIQIIKKEKKAKEGEIDDGIKNYVFCAWNYS